MESTDTPTLHSGSRSAAALRHPGSVRTVIYRDAARVPRGRTEDFVFRDDETRSVSNHLTPRVNRVIFITQSTEPLSTVATWIKDLNSKQLPAVAKGCDTPQNPATAGETGVVGRGGAAGPHGRTGRSGVNSNRPIAGRSGEIKFACDGTARFWACGQNGEAAGLVPAVLHTAWLSGRIVADAIGGDGCGVALETDAIDAGPASEGIDAESVFDAIDTEPASEASDEDVSEALGIESEDGVGVGDGDSLGLEPDSFSEATDEDVAREIAD